MNRTKIPWVLNPDGTPGYTWNPITGCLNHTGGMCKGGGFPCFAYRLANGRLKSRYLTNKNIAPNLINNKTWNEGWFDPFYPRLWPERLPTYFEGKARGVFVCDMSDLFGVGIPEDWTRAILGTIKRSPTGWRFYLLTKQPQNLIKFSPFPENCYVGVTMTNGYDDTLVSFKDVKAKVKYISFEPLLNWASWASSDMIKRSLKDAGINWLIIGAQTRPKVLPKIEWVREIIEAADMAGIPVFLKDNLGYPQVTADGSPPFYRKDKSDTWVLREEVPA